MWKMSLKSKLWSDMRPQFNYHQTQKRLQQDHDNVSSISIVSCFMWFVLLTFQSHWVSWHQIGRHNAHEIQMSTGWKIKALIWDEASVIRLSTRDNVSWVVSHDSILFHLIHLHTSFNLRWPWKSCVAYDQESQSVKVKEIKALFHWMRN